MTGSPGIMHKVFCRRQSADAFQNQATLRSPNTTLAPFMAAETGDTEISTSKLKLSANGMLCYTHGTGGGHATPGHSSIFIGGCFLSGFPAGGRGHCRR